MLTTAFVCGIMFSEVIESFLLIGIRGNSILTELNHFFYFFFQSHIYCNITKVRRETENSLLTKSQLCGILKQYQQMICANGAHNKVTLSGEAAVPCICNPLQQRGIPALRGAFVSQPPAVSC